MDGEDEQFAHAANGTIIANAGNTAQRGRNASHYEFATGKALRMIKVLVPVDGPESALRAVTHVHERTQSVTEADRRRSAQREAGLDLSMALVK
ncbi:MAG: hypothetical protein ACXW2A_17005 [Burkholderiales bacterium]